MVGRVLAANLGKHVGDKIEIYSHPYDIVGIYESPIVFENGGAIIPLKDMQAETNKPGKVSAFIITVE